MSDASGQSAPYAPRYPTMVALAVFCAGVLILFLPIFQGQFLGGHSSDQTWTGIPIRQFWVDEVRRAGGIPLWNPFMFGGLPFVGAMHGDMFYPGSWLRLLVPVDMALNLGFALHFVLAGLFTWGFLRALGVSWTAALAGGVAYQFSGILASLVQPGHDGKLYVSALLPLMLHALLLAIRKRRAEGYGLLALVVGVGILTPQTQMMQYALFFAGLFTLWLAFGDEQRPGTPKARLAAVGLALGAVLIGVGIAMIQIMPFLANAPWAARTVGAQGWEYATSYAMPPENILDWLIPEFTGILEKYWGSNFFKLHSEYVGAATLGLVALGAVAREHRRLIWFLAGAGMLFLLVSLGGHTPFYRLWYAVVPGVKVTRAPGMAFFIPAFIFSLLAAFGVARLERGEGRKTLVFSLVAAGVLLLLGASGALGGMAESLARPELRERAANNADAIAFGAVRSALVLAALAGIGLAVLAGKLKGAAPAVALTLLIGADLVFNARRFFEWSPPASELYADDVITRRLHQDSLPFRVLDVPEPNGIYRTAFLMAKRIPNALGHHGNELHAYDELMGGKNVWRNLLTTTRLWDLLALKYVLLPGPLPIAGYSLVERGHAGAPSQRGVLQEAFLYQADSVPPYARVVSGAAKLDEERIIPTLMDYRFDYNRVVLLLPDAPVEVAPLDSIPPRSPSRARVTGWEPGAMTIRLDPAPASDSWLVVSENWYPDWRAEVNGSEAPVLRGQFTLITVPLRAGASEVTLRVRSASYSRGRAVSFASLAAAALLIAVPVVLRRRRG
jgi:hypothetical protein